MKKIFALVLMLVYISASGGVVLNVHYCMGEISSVNIEHNDDEAGQCARCGMAEESNSCCRSEFKILKVDNLHKASLAVFNIDVPNTILPAKVSLIDASKLVAAKTERHIVHSPPLSDPDLNLLHCVFRI